MALLSLLVTLSPTVPLTGMKIASPSPRSMTFCVPLTVLITITGVPPALLTYLTYMYVTADTELAIRVSWPEFVTEPEARLVTGACIVSASVQDIANPVDVVSADPLDETESLVFKVPIVVLC